LEILEGILSSLVATALATVAALSYARTRKAYRVSRRYRDTIDRMKNSGVTEVFFSRAQYATASDKAKSNILVYLSTAHIRLRYIGLWMAQASELYRLDETIRRLLERGCEVQFCVLDPRMSATKFNAVADALGSTPTEVRQRVKIAVEKLLSLWASLPQDLQGRLTLRVHDKPLTASLIEFDWDTEYHRCWLDMKLRGRGRAESITLEVGPGVDPLISRITSSFTDVVINSRPAA
jgi:hypothetical protein